MPSAFKQTCICRKANRKWVSRMGGGGVNARGEEAGSHSFTHNFLKTEWGCLHKAKKRVMARKDFVAVHFPTLYRGWGGGKGGEGNGGGRGMVLQHKLDEEKL